LGAGQIGARDQRIGGERAALVTSQHLAVPFSGIAIARLQSSPRHGDLGLAEAAGQRAPAAAVPVTQKVCWSAVGILCAAIPRASERRIELTSD
jgi:hypothetical protein